MKIVNFFIIFCMISGSAAMPSSAQSTTNAERQLLHLAETLGAVHYLGALCQQDYDDSWRSEMETILKTEAATGDQKDRYVSAFNYGFDLYRDTHNQCLLATQRLIARRLREGHELISDITRYYSR